MIAERPPARSEFRWPPPHRRLPAPRRHRRVGHACGRRQGQGAQGGRRAGHRVRGRRAGLRYPCPHRRGRGRGLPRPLEPQVLAGRRPPAAARGDRRQDVARLAATRCRPLRCSSPTAASTPSTTPSWHCSTLATRCCCRRPTGRPIPSPSRSPGAFLWWSTPTRPAASGSPSISWRRRRPTAPRCSSSCRRRTRPAPSIRAARSRRSAVGRSSAGSGSSPTRSTST